MTGMRPDTLLLSVHPRYASLMVAGEKTVEIRRVRPTVESGTLVLIYATTPKREVVATGSLERLVSAGADRLWQRYGRDACLTRQAMREYLRGASRPTALLLEAVSPLTAPIPLANLQHSVPHFRPPQSYRFLSPELLKLLDLPESNAGKRVVHVKRANLPSRQGPTAGHQSGVLGGVTP